MKLQFHIDECKVPPGMFLLEVSSDEGLESNPRCTVCNSEWDEVIKVKAADSTHYLARGYCLNCGYCGTSRTFTSEWTKNYYSKAWTNLKYVEEAERASQFSNETTGDFIARHVPDKNAVILDAGAGIGSGIKALHKRGYKNVEALELSERRIRILKERYPGVKVDHTPLQDLRKSNVLSKKYDAMYLWHVFEHLTDLHDCMNAISEAVKEGGHLFIAVPLFHEEHFSNLAFLHVHLHTFQPHTLDYLLSMYGFTAVEKKLTFDGNGIRAMYKKTGSKKPGGDPQHLVSRAQNRNAYHEKLFKDYQLIYLAHQPEWTRKGLILSFHYNSSFAGSCLHRYPTKWCDRLLYRWWVRGTNALLRKRTFMSRVYNKLANLIIKPLAIPEGSTLFSRIDGIPSPEKVDDFRLIYDTDQLVKNEFIYPGNTIKMWLQ